MKPKNIITMLFAAFFMVLITIICYTNMGEFSRIDFAAVFMLSLTVIYPILFLLQGIICALNKTNVFLALGISIFSFVVLLIVYLNSSAFVYILIYTSLGVLGYLVAYFIKKFKPSKNA